jgi:hypothetical protein
VLVEVNVRTESWLRDPELPLSPALGAHRPDVGAAVTSSARWHLEQAALAHP